MTIVGLVILKAVQTKVGWKGLIKPQYLPSVSKGLTSYTGYSKKNKWVSHHKWTSNWQKYDKAGAQSGQKLDCRLDYKILLSNGNIHVWFEIISFFLAHNVSKIAVSVFPRPP